MSARTMSTIEAVRSLVEKFDIDYDLARDYFTMMKLDKASITQDEYNTVCEEVAFSQYCGQNDC